MSWLYTIVFAGLMASSQGGEVPSIAPLLQSEPVTTGVAAGDETEKFEQIYQMSAGGRVSVSNINGSITVEAWDRSEVKLEYTKTADTKEGLNDVEIIVESRPDSFGVRTEYGDWKAKQGSATWRHNNKLTVEFRLMVPRGAVLNDVETVNGSVTVSNFVNITRVSAVNGSVNAANIRGTAKLCTVNGEVTANFDRLESGSKITLETVNGQVNLVIPSDANATVRADSLNGNITNDFGLPVRKGKYIGRDLYGRLGAGDVQIRLNSVNGGLAIGRKNDGKALSPVTNLLPQKEKDDDEWDKTEDKEDESSFKAAKVDKEVAKAVKASEKAASKAIVDAQNQLNRIQPEIGEAAAASVVRAAEALKVFESKEFKLLMDQSVIDQADQVARMTEAGFLNTVPRVETKRGSFTVKGTPKVMVDAKGCSVSIRGWEKSEVQYRVTQFSDPGNRTPIAVTETHSDSSVNLRVANPSYEARGGMFGDEARGVRIEIMVPKRSNLKISANGEIRLDGVSGDVELVGSDEVINVRDVDGKLKVSNSDGRVRVIGFKGEIDSTTADGDVYLEGDFSRITGSAGGGNFYLTVPDAPNMDIRANVEALSIENLLVPETINEGHWRFGSGGPRYTFKMSDGQVFVRSVTSLTK